MPTPIALQLYSVRDALAQDFTGTLRRIAACGYVAVETAGFPPGVTAEAARRVLDDLGLRVCAAHAPLPLGDQQNAVLDQLAALGCDRLVLAWQPPEKFATEAGVAEVRAQLNAAVEVTRAHGLRLGYHNHDFEFAQLNGRTAHAALREGLAPDVFFELDTYWIKVAGLDPAAVVGAFGAHAPLLHLKDGPAVREAPMTALGEGVVDVPAIVAASQADWLIVELDRCATDMLTAVEASYHYLTQKGLAHGQR